MDEGQASRRTVLGLLGTGIAGVGGCLGVGQPEPRCAADGVEIVLESQLRGWYVDYPATTGLFDVDGQDRKGPARRLAALAKSEGYTVEYYYSEDARGTDDEWQIELYGELDRTTVEDLVARADMPTETDISEQIGTLNRGSELRAPWSPGLLDGRATYLADNSSTVDVSIPSLGPANSKAVTLTETPDEATLSWLQSTLSGRGILRVRYLNISDDDSVLTENQFSNYNVAKREGEDPYFTDTSVRLRQDGAVVVDIRMEDFLETLWRPRREDNVWRLDEARIGISLDGRRIAERPLTTAERDYVRDFDASVGFDEDRERPTAPPLVVDSLDPRTALRTATLLKYPEDARFGVEVRGCETN